MSATDNTRNHWHWFALALIVLLGAALRAWGITYGLPYTYPADEPNYLLITLKIIQSGDLNPHWWFYPSLMFYLNALALLLYFFVGRVLGLFGTLADLPPPQIVTMGVGVMPLPSMLLTVRALNALFGIAAIVVLYLSARRAHPNKAVALVAALLLAVSPTAVAYSQQLGPDTFALFFSLVSFLFAVRIADDPRTRNYVGAGLGAGLAIASKYNAGVILIALIVAHLARYGWRGVWRRELYVGMIVAALAFFLGTPFAVFDFPNFIEGIRWQIFSYSVEGHAGEEGNALAWYVAYLLSQEGLAVLGAVVGIVYAFFARAKRYWVVLSFPLPYFLIVSQMVTRNARTIMLIVPFLGLLTAIVVVELCEWLERTGRVKRSAVVVALLAFVFLMLAIPARETIAADLRLSRSDGRETARQWIAANVPPGSRIALEAYSPYVDRQKFVAQGFYGLPEHLPEWYAAQGFEYLVLSEGAYGRYFADPTRYPDQVKQYDQFFARYPLTARFDDNDWEIRIYKTDVALPSQRVAARFGDYAELIELIGYDDVQWTRGDPLRVRLFWRTLGSKPEPFEVELRLLGQADQEIATVRSDVFQSKGWRTGMFDGIFTLPVPADVPPGQYRVQVNVIWTRYAYSLPAFSWAVEKIDPVILQPIERK